MRMKKTGILAGITVACICIAQTVPAFGAGQDLVGFVPNEEKQEETQVKSYLTGENVPESIGRRRPVAVMMGNNSVGAPQSGIGHAGVVYEAPVEGNITRLMGILEDTMGWNGSVPFAAAVTIISFMPTNLMQSMPTTDRLPMHCLIWSSM